MTDAGPEQSVVQRFTDVQVYVHAIFASSVFVLLLTGLPITFHDKLGWILLVIGYQNVVLIHVVGAVSLIGSVLYYVLFVVSGFLTDSVSLPAFPARRDVDDAIQHVRYLLGWTEKPSAGKYTFLQKAEIWILSFEIVVLVITGFVLWYRGLLVEQGRAYLLFRDVHAVVALTMLMGIVFHLFNTHLTERAIDWAMFTGEVTVERAREDWPDWVAVRQSTPPAADGGEQSVGSKRTSTVILNSGIVVGTIIALAAIYTGILLQTVLAPLPSEASLLGWLTGGVPDGILGWIWAFALNLVVLVLLAGFIALLYGISRRLLGKTP